MERGSQVGEWFGKSWQEFSLIPASRGAGEGGSIERALDILNKMLVFSKL